MHNICMKSECIQVWVSCESVDQAKSMVETLLNERIIACGQIVPKVESFYRWQGQIESAVESLLVLKTTTAQFSALKHLVKRLHSYETPEIIATPITAGSNEYLNWINEQVKPED